MSRLLLLLLTLPLLLGCTVSADGNDDGGPCSDADSAGEVQLSGLAYVDADLTDASIHDSSFDAEADAPVAGARVQLFSADGVSEGTSCEGGDFQFGGLEDGIYVLAPELDAEGKCMQRNCTSRFPDALEDGAVKIVTMGDSVPVVGDDVRFPARLATLLDPLADIDNTNVAVGGSLSTEWLPGTSHFENRLAPEVEDADVVLISVGGNDILASLDASALQDPEGTVADTKDLVEQIADNVLATIEGIREINPDIDVVYCIYVDYGQAAMFPWGIIGNMVGQEAITDVLKTARDRLSIEEDILIADLFGASHGLTDPLDDYLSDSLHFNDRGHTFYAEEIFMTLGGALLGDSPLGGQPRSDIGLNKTWSLSE